MQPIRSHAPVFAALAFACVLTLAVPSIAAAASIRVQDDDTHLRFTGRTRTIVTSAASASSRRALWPSASAEVSFTGTSVRVIGPKGPGLGRVRVYLDGSQVATVSAAAGRLYEQRALYSAAGLTDAPHVLKLVALEPFAVDAFDLSGVVGSVDREHPIVRVDSADLRLSFTDFWATTVSAYASGGSLKTTKVAGASALIAFNGTEVAWIGQRWPAGGKARVYLDGADAGTVSQWAPSLRANRVLYSRGGLSDGPHTLRVSVLGSRDAVSRGLGVGVDAFDVAGSVTPSTTRIGDDDRRLRYQGAWRTVSSPSGRTQTTAVKAGATVSLYFRGTRSAVIADRGPRGGIALVYVDGLLKDTVDLYAAAFERGATVTDVSGLSSARHVLTVKVAGTHSAASAGSEVAIDGFEVVGDVTLPNMIAGHNRLQSGDSRFARGGAWSSLKTPAALSGASLAATARGAKLYMEFTGTQFTWYGTRSKRGGRARILVDGTSVATVSLYSSGTGDQRAIFTLGGLKRTRHKVVIEVMGSHESASSGTQVSVDWFDADGVFWSARRPSPFNYPWHTYIVIDKSECNLYWVRNDSLVKVYRCAVGKPSTPTPDRIWKIGMKYHTDWGSVYGPRKMRLFKQTGSGYQYTAYNIHGTNQEWVIGTWASHGCIRMYNRDVLELFPQVAIGTMVVTKD